MGYTFLQKPSSFKFLSNLEENCGADINNGTIKCKFLLTNVSKNGRWVSYTFLQKLSSFKFYSILEEKCVADIINETMKCNTFVDKCWKKRYFEWFILSYKSQVLSSFSAFQKKIVLPTSIMKQLNVRLLLRNVSKNGLLSG